MGLDVVQGMPERVADPAAGQVLVDALCRWARQLDDAVARLEQHRQRSAW